MTGLNNLSLTILPCKQRSNIADALPKSPEKRKSEISKKEKKK
jgi:hypothetical protein